MRKGSQLTEEHKRKLSEAAKRYWATPQAQRRARAKRVSEETKAKMRESALRRHARIREMEQRMRELGEPAS